MPQASVKIVSRFALTVAAGVALAFTAVTSYSDGATGYATDFGTNECTANGGGMGILCGDGSRPKPPPAPECPNGQAPQGSGQQGITSVKSSEDGAGLFCIW
jgi:hypothetical protein